MGWWFVTGRYRFSWIEVCVDIAVVVAIAVVVYCV